MTLYQTVAAVISVCVVIALRRLYKYTIRPRFFLRGVPRIEEPNRLVHGHFPLIFKASPDVQHQKWHAKYGPVFNYDGIFNTVRVSITDRAALNYILVSHYSEFPKPNASRRMLSELLGEGLLVVEGADHTRQRKIMNPAFGPTQIKALFSLFSEKALEFRNVMLAKVAEKGGEPVELDVCEYAARTTLDVIASAGFGYETHAIERGDTSELSRSFNEVLHSVGQFHLALFLTYMFPFLGHLVKHTKGRKAIHKAGSIVHRISREIVDQKRSAVLAHDTQSEIGDEKHAVGKDLLSILVTANMADNLKPSQRLTEDEVMAQISTFLFAGNDTTATGISWVMYALCKNSSIQDKLRAEIRAVPNEHPTYEALSSLPYLDAVIRETLRFQPPISGTSRIAAKDCIVPLSTPITRPDGSTLPQLRIAAGTHIFIPIQTTLNDPDVWGPDANEFKPERWLSPNGVPDGAMEIPSIKFLPFLAGPRACIGFRFSITEMKIVIFSLIRVMSFELAVDPDDIEPKARVVTRPRVKSRPEEGFQLPVLVRAL